MGKLFVVVIALLGLAGCSQEEPPSKAEAPRTGTGVREHKGYSKHQPSSVFRRDGCAKHGVRTAGRQYEGGRQTLARGKLGNLPGMGRNTPSISGKMLPSRMERLSTPRPSKRIWTP